MIIKTHSSIFSLFFKVRDSTWIGGHGANKGGGDCALVCMAKKKSVGDLGEAELKGKRVLVCANLNVPLDDKLVITDDTRIRATVPTIKYLIKNGAKVILSRHLECNGPIGLCFLYRSSWFSCQTNSLCHSLRNFVYHPIFYLFFATEDFRLLLPPPLLHV